MTTPSTALRRTEPPAWSWASLREDSRQFIAVLILLVVALLAGLLLKGFTEGQTRIVRGGGISAAVPADWVYQPGAGDLLFVVNDPRQPGHRYLVTRIADASARPHGSRRHALRREVAAASRPTSRFRARPSRSAIGPARP